MSRCIMKAYIQVGKKDGLINIRGYKTRRIGYLIKMANTNPPKTVFMMCISYVPTCQ